MNGMGLLQPRIGPYPGPRRVGAAQPPAVFQGETGRPDEPLDSLNERLYPQFTRGFGRYHQHALAAAEILRRALSYDLYWHLIPDQANAAVIASGRFQARISFPVGTYVWAFSGSASAAAGFQTQVYEPGAESNWFSAPIANANLVGGTAAGAEGIVFPLYILPMPRLIIEPGILIVTIENLAAVANTIQLVIWAAQPRCPMPTELEAA